MQKIFVILWSSSEMNDNFTHDKSLLGMLRVHCLCRFLVSSIVFSGYLLRGTILSNVRL